MSTQKRTVGQYFSNNMINPSVIIIWPSHVDYPLCRFNLNKFKDYFKDINIIIQNTGRPYSYLNTLQNMRGNKINLLKTFGNLSDDWRDDAIKSYFTTIPQSEYLLFLEQDFMMKDLFFDIVLTANKDFVYYEEGGRIHPAFALVSLKLLNATSCDFSARPPSHDHFGLFFEEVKKVEKGKELREFGLVERKDFYHLAGLTQNYACVENKQPLYKPDEFLAYNHHCLNMSEVLVKQDNNFVFKMGVIESKYGSGDKDGFINDFFPKEKE